MYFVKTPKDGSVCVSNCESVGLFLDTKDNICVGCHPACASCSGPDNDDCYECADGFLQIDNTTCDTECFPENSFIENSNQCVGKSIYFQI